MTPTETLAHEHQVILLVLRGAEREAKSIAATQRVDVQKVETLLDFFRNFADRCHHAKEEKLLFPLMEERGVPNRGGPIGVMLMEHNQGRAYLRAVGDALELAGEGDGAAVEAVRSNLLAYVNLLRAHIDKENNVLFPMADRVLTDADRESLAEAFDRVEAEEMGEGTHERYHQLAHELAEG
jgi:hemerythrin-like domain-containing protein